MYFYHCKLHDAKVQFVKKELFELCKFSTIKDEYEVPIFIGLFYNHMLITIANVTIGGV